MTQQEIDRLQRAIDEAVGDRLRVEGERDDLARMVRESKSKLLDYKDSSWETISDAVSGRKAAEAELTRIRAQVALMSRFFRGQLRPYGDHRYFCEQQPMDALLASLDGLTAQAAPPYPLGESSQVRGGTAR